MARLSRDDVLACVLDSDDSDDAFGLVDSSSEGEQDGETEEVTAFMGQQVLSRDSLEYLSDTVADTVADRSIDMSTDDEQLLVEQQGDFSKFLFKRRTVYKKY